MDLADETLDAQAKVGMAETEPQRLMRRCQETGLSPGTGTDETKDVDRGKIVGGETGPGSKVGNEFANERVQMGRCGFLCEGVDIDFAIVVEGVNGFESGNEFEGRDTTTANEVDSQDANESMPVDCVVVDGGDRRRCEGGPGVSPTIVGVDGELAAYELYAVQS